MAVVNAVTLELVKPVHGGYCLAFSDGITYLVEGGLPGEVVEAEIIGGKKRLRYARVSQVTQANPNRIPHIWPLAEQTKVGGVDLGHVSYRYQADWKSQVLAESLERLGGEQVWEQAKNLNPVVTNPTSEATELAAAASRTRIEFEIDRTGSPAMYAQNSNELVAIDSLVLATGQIQEADILTAKSPFRKVWKPGQRIRVAQGDNGVKVAVNKTCYDHHAHLDADGLMRHRLSVPFQCDYRVAVTDFWQSHPLAPQILVEAVVVGAGENPGTVWELYSGSGLLTVPLAKVSLGVIAVEGSRGACQRGAENLSLNGCEDTVTVLNQAVNAASLASLSADYGQPDTLVLDPPRSGAGLETIRQINRVSPQRIIYVACDPAALARDLKELVGAGYEIEKVKGWNLFPFTHHFETVATLHKR